MFWQEDKANQEFQVPDDVVDLVFGIECRELPVDHSHALAVALRHTLPWLAEDARIGIHAVFVAGSQNGWERPDPSLGQRLILSRRTKLTLRAPRDRIEQIQAELKDVTVDIAGFPMTIHQARIRALSKQTTIFSRSIVLEASETEDENLFLERVAAEFARRHIHMRKALCGKSSTIQSPDGAIATRSLMLADLKPEESVALQETGLGPHRQLGCGIFLAHKGIDAVIQAEDK